MRVLGLIAMLVLFGCADPVARVGGDGGALPADTAAAPLDASSSSSDAPTRTLDGGMDAGSPSLPPAGSRPPSPPPDLSSVVYALAAERPGDLASSCVEMGGTNAFLFELVRRLRAIDVRWGLDRDGGVLDADHVAYFWGDGAAEGSREVYVLDVIGSHCSRSGIDAPPSATWLDVSEGGMWSLVGLGIEVPIDGGTPMDHDAGTPPVILPLPDARGVVNALAAERPDLLAASCVADGGHNEFLFELVRRLRAMDPRWGLNWKRGNVGDMSQDVVDYYYGSGDPVESSTDVHIIDVIGGHCGPSPSPAFTDVTEATRAGGTIGRWTLAGRGDLGP
jgi:hypothetical protein